MKKEDILELLFWLFVILGILMLIWSITGHSPSELEIILALIIGLFFKTWSISTSLAELKGKLDTEIPSIKDRIKKLEEKQKS